MPSSNPTDSADLDGGQNRNLQNPSVLATRATLKKRLDFGSATRNASAARRHAPSCMGATELQSNWPDMRKTLGKPCEWKVESRAVLRTGQDWIRTTREIPGEIEV